MDSTIKKVRKKKSKVNLKRDEEEEGVKTMGEDESKRVVKKKTKKKKQKNTEIGDEVKEENAEEAAEGEKKEKKKEEKKEEKKDDKKDGKKDPEKEKEGDKKADKKKKGKDDKDKEDKNKKNKNDEEAIETVNQPQPDHMKGTPTEGQCMAYEKFVREMLNLGIDGLFKEFNKELRSYIPKVSSFATEIFKKNMTKNRYRDIACNDLTRVIIADGGKSDYIHANHVKSEPLHNKFICTQGPMKSTINDFWRMVCHEGVENIIMLCETVETGKVKCDQYWPLKEADKKKYGDVSVTHMSKTSSSGVTKTVLEVEKPNGEKYTLTHHHWKTWPDKSAPKSTKCVFRILRDVRMSKKPVVVHCSAGVGRTGTLVAIEMCLQQIVREKPLSMMMMCRKLREQRLCSVQVDMQYIYIAVALCDYGFSMKYVTDADLAKEFKEMLARFERCLAAPPPQPKKSTAPGGVAGAGGAVVTPSGTDVLKKDDKKDSKEAPKDKDKDGKEAPKDGKPDEAAVKKGELEIDIGAAAADGKDVNVTQAVTKSCHEDGGLPPASDAAGAIPLTTVGAAPADAAAVPAGVAPGTTPAAAGETKPGADAKTDAKPGETKPGEAKPGEAKPGDPAVPPAATAAAATETPNATPPAAAGASTTPADPAAAPPPPAAPTTPAPAPALPTPTMPTDNAVTAPILLLQPPPPAAQTMMVTAPLAVPGGAKGAAQPTGPIATDEQLISTPPPPPAAPAAPTPAAPTPTPAATGGQSMMGPATAPAFSFMTKPPAQNEAPQSMYSSDLISRPPPPQPGGDFRVGDAFPTGPPRPKPRFNPALFGDFRVGMSFPGSRTM